MQKTSDNVYILLLLSMGGVFMLVVAFILIFIRHQNKLLKQQRQLQQAQIAHQQELLLTVIESQEAERKRIGQDLHDDVGTALSNLRIIIERFGQDNYHNPETFKVTGKKIIDKVIQDVRYISHNLSPSGIELYGFMGALEEFCEFISTAHRLQVDIADHTANLPDQLNQTAAISLYRVMEELLNNTIKHARASRVNIGFEAVDGLLLVSYSDNGRGIAPANQDKRGMGLLNIESRLGIIGATFSIIALEDSGFNILIKIKP
jgi:signal transduction histidine kinase